MLMRVKLELALYDYDVAAGYRQLVLWKSCIFCEPLTLLTHIAISSVYVPHMVTL